MNVGAVVGITLGIISPLVGYSMFGGRMVDLLQWRSIFILSGGWAGALLVQFQWDEIRSAIRMLRRVFGASKEYDRELRVLEVMVQELEEEGPQAFEKHVPELRDPFLVRAMGRIVEVDSAEELEELIFLDMEVEENQLLGGSEFWRSSGWWSILMGLVVALVAWLSGVYMRESGLIAFPCALGLWGAGLFCFPIGRKLKMLGEKERRRMEMALNHVLKINDLLEREEGGCSCGHRGGESTEALGTIVEKATDRIVLRLERLEKKMDGLGKVPAGKKTATKKAKTGQKSTSAESDGDSEE